MACAMTSMSCVQQGQQGAAYVALVPQCFAPPQYSQPHFQYFQVPQSFQVQQRQQELLQHQQNCCFFQAQLMQVGRSDSSMSVSTKCGDISLCSSPTGGIGTPNACDLLPAGSSPSTPTGQLQAAPTGRPEAVSLCQPEVVLAGENILADQQQGIPVPGNVVKLSYSKEGCLKVQEAFDSAPTDEGRAALAAELRGHVVRAAKCSHANHVLQKYVTTVNPQSSQFIVDELCGLGPGMTKIAKHKYGCRIFQRLIESCCPAQVQLLVEIIMADALTLSRHLYGTYVVQSIIEHGTRDQRCRIAKLLMDHVELMGADIHGSATLSIALHHAEEADGLKLARALLREPGMLAAMAQSRRGHPAVIRVLDALDGQRESGIAINQLLAEVQSLRSCRYGKLVLAHLMDMVDMAGRAQESWAVDCEGMSQERRSSSFWLAHGKERD